MTRPIFAHPDGLPTVSLSDAYDKEGAIRLCKSVIDYWNNPDNDQTQQEA